MTTMCTWKALDLEHFKEDVVFREELRWRPFLRCAFIWNWNTKSIKLILVESNWWLSGTHCPSCSNVAVVVNDFVSGEENGKLPDKHPINSLVRELEWWTSSWIYCSHHSFMYLAPLEKKPWGTLYWLNLLSVMNNAFAASKASFVHASVIFLDRFYICWFWCYVKINFVVLLFFVKFVLDEDG